MDTTALSQLSMAFPAFGDASVLAFEVSGAFFLTDPNTCGVPRRIPCDPNCQKDILKINSADALTIMPFDKWLSSGKNEKCDFLIFDSGTTKQKFVFCELTCSQQKYVDPSPGNIGKRAKAFNQIEKSWEAIYNSDNPIFRAYVLQFVEKIGIFGWRESNNSATQKHGASRSMRQFSRTPGSQSSITTYSAISFGEHFNYIQVKHPAVYQW